MERFARSGKVVGLRLMSFRTERSPVRVCFLWLKGREFWPLGFVVFCVSDGSSDVRRMVIILWTVADLTGGVIVMRTPLANQRLCT